MSITLTEKAANEVKRIFAEQDLATEEKAYLRLRILGGGCSGFQHKLDLDTNFNEKLDEISEQHGVQVVVDKRSAVYTESVTIDFSNDLNKCGFIVDNSASTGKCGCGSSFSM